MNRFSTRCGWTLVASAIASLSLVSCSQAISQPQPHPTATRTIRSDSYKVDSSPSSAVNFFDNQSVFEGTVVDVLPDVRVVDLTDSGAGIEAVYTPVIMRVDASFGGDFQAGDEVRVRAMGGQADGVSYVSLSAPAKSTFEVGNRLMMFTGELSALATERDPAVTPYFIYRQIGSDYVDATSADGTGNGDPASVIDILAMRALVTQVESAKR